jgi:hypothetical protein
MSNNGTVKLSEDVITGRFGPGITAKNTVKLNLNSHNLAITGLTASSAQPAIMSRGTQNITIGGKGIIDAGQGVCIEANGKDSVINLTSPTTTYQTDRSGGELVYCYAGTINITNGTFKNNGSPYLLNCYDANYRSGTAKIIVSGGKFYDFNPMDNSAEGEHTNFLAEGYHVEISTVVEDEVEHDHSRGCCDKFCSLVELMIGEGKVEGPKPPCSDLLKISLIFIFGNPFMFTYRYYKFFNGNKIIDNDCVHNLFIFANLFVNIITACGIFYFSWLALFILLFIPSVVPCYFYFIYYNWDFLIDNLDLDETPLLELTVRGRGYDLY